MGPLPSSIGRQDALVLSRSASVGSASGTLQQSANSRECRRTACKAGVRLHAQAGAPHQLMRGHPVPKGMRIQISES